MRSGGFRNGPSSCIVLIKILVGDQSSETDLFLWGISSRFLAGLLLRIRGSYLLRRFPFGT